MGRQAVSSAPLTPREAQTLELIRKHQPVGRSALAKMMKITPSTLSNYLDALRVKKEASPSGRGPLTTWSVRALPVSDIFSMAQRMAAP